MRGPAVIVAWTIVLLSLFAPPSLAKRRNKGGVRNDGDYKNAPSYRYGALDAPACIAELNKRKIKHVRLEARGVLIPVRIPDGVRGIRFHTLLPPKKGSKSPWEVFDCRLVLGLHDFARILRTHGVDDVVIFSAWRPNKKHPKDKPAKRHPGALAVDIAKLGIWEGEGDDKRRVWLNVKKDWHGRIGAKTCGPKAAKPRKRTAAARKLRQIVCAAAKLRLFTSILTPNYDRAHHNHFHFDITPGAKWRLVK